jgi:hypothetical protein
MADSRNCGTNARPLHVEPASISMPCCRCAAVAWIRSTPDTLQSEKCGRAYTCDFIGAPKTNRTSDLPLRRGLLYPLSYRGVGRHCT